MAEAIGNVRASFTASAEGLVGAIRQSVESLDGLRAAQSSAAASAQSASAVMERSNAAAAESVKASNAAMRDAARIARDVRTPAETYAATIQKLDNYLARGLLTQEVYGRAVLKAKAQMDATTAAAGSQASAMQSLGETQTSVSRAVDGLATSFRGFADSVRSIADAGSSIVKLGERITEATIAWRTFKAVTAAYTSPEGILRLALGLGRTIAVISVAEAGFKAFGVDVSGVADFATKASVAFALFKATAGIAPSTAGIAAYAAQMNATYGITTTLTAGLARMGVTAGTQAAVVARLGTVGSVLGGHLARLAAMSIPGFGQLAAATYLTVKAFFSSRDAANETATAVAGLTREAERLGVTFQDLQIQKALDAGRTRDEIGRLGLAITAIDAGHFDDLALANERAAASAANTKSALAAVGTTIASTFTGAFAGISEGAAGLSAGFADLVGGINALATPVAQVLRPFGTLLGTAVQAAGQLAGVLLSSVGAAARFAGSLAQLALSPVIVGFNNFADTIRQGVGAAFEWLSAQVEGVQKRITALQSSLAQIPVLGKVFASSQGGTAGVAPAAPQAPASAANAAAAAEAAKESAREEAEAMRSVTSAIATQERALSGAIQAAQAYGQEGFAAAVRYQESLRALNAQLEAGILNETSYGSAAAAAKGQFDEQVEALRERGRAIEAIGDQIARSADAGKALGAAGEAAREQFRGVAEGIRGELEKRLLSPDDARARMREAADAMNAELGRIGEGMKFAERIRDQFKTAAEKAAEELAAIDANEFLSPDEKDRAKAGVRERAAASLPGGFDDDPVSKFRSQQEALSDALANRVIGEEDFALRQAKIREELDASVADFREQQARGGGPDRRDNKAAEVNSSEGVATFFRILRGEDGPTEKQIAEARKQTRLLERVAEVLGEEQVVQL